MQVTDNARKQRLEIDTGHGIAYLAYRRDGDSLVLVHTVVPESERGQGIGGELVEGAVKLAIAQNMRIVAECSFAKHWLHEHPSIAQGANLDGPGTA